MVKNKVGAPLKPENEKKKALTVSITPAINAKALKLFRTRGKAIELAVKYSKEILKAEAAQKKKNWEDDEN